jgi:hypothetical protein
MRSSAACARPFAPASWWRLGQTRSGRDASVRVSASLRWDPSLTRDGDPTGGDDRECEPGLREEPVCLGPETQDGEHPRLKSSLPGCAHSLFCAARFWLHQTVNAYKNLHQCAI